MPKLKCSKVHTATKCTSLSSDVQYGREARFPSEVSAELPVSLWSLLCTITRVWLCVCLCVGVWTPQSSVSERRLKKRCRSLWKRMYKRGKRSKWLHMPKEFIKNVKRSITKQGIKFSCFSMRKRGRKGGRLQPDLSDPSIIKDLCGKRVTLVNSDGKTLNATYNVNHIKQYWRPESKDFVTAER